MKQNLISFLCRQLNYFGHKGRKREKKKCPKSTYCIHSEPSISKPIAIKSPHRLLYTEQNKVNHASVKREYDRVFGHNMRQRSTTIFCIFLLDKLKTKIAPYNS